MVRGMKPCGVEGHAACGNGSHPQECRWERCCRSRAIGDTRDRDKVVATAERSTARKGLIEAHPGTSGKPRRLIPAFQIRISPGKVSQPVSNPATVLAAPQRGPI